MKIFLLVSEKPFEVKLLASDNDVLEMVSKLPRNHYVHVYLEEVLTASSVANVEPEINVEVSDAGSFEPEINVEIGDAGSFEPRINVEVSDVAGSFEPEFNVEVSDAAGSFEPDFNVEDNDDVDSFEPDCNVEVSDAVIVSDDDSLEENIGELSEIRVESNSDSGDIDYEASKSSTHESGFIDSDAEASDDVSNVHARVSDKVRVDIDDDSGHSDSLHSVDESDSDGPRWKQRFPELNTTVDISDSSFKVGLLFATKQVLREAVKMYSIKNRCSVKLKRNENRRIQAVCKAGCPWVLWASPVDIKEPYGTWQIKSLIVEHKCLKEYKNSNITSKFMAKQYLDTFHIDLNYSAKSLKQDVFRNYSIYVHLSKCSKAKNLTLERLHDNVKEQYKKLYDYLAELRSSNPGTTTILQLNETVFERLHICMQAMKDGFKAGCRPIICLDGCHLKGYYGGHLLPAVGMDANDSLYPLAFVVVEVESESWCWFLERLMTDFELNNSHHISFMTDRQKGLMEVVMELFSHAEHRTCVRHLYNNFKLGGDHKRKSLKDQLWKAARATYVGEFEVAMTTLHIRRPSQPTMHQDQSTAPSPRPNQSDIHPQSNIPRPSQPVPPPYTVRWMPTPTIPFTQEPHTASPSQFDIHLQRNIPRPSQLLPPPYTVRWMPTSTVPFTQESHTATPNQFGIHPQINIPRPSQPLTPPYIVRWMPTPTIPLTQESFVTQPSPQDLAEKRLRSDP
ncbi:hypothetical protein V6N13_092789 [Hibiscus sabdariffa]